MVILKDLKKLKESDLVNLWLWDKHKEAVQWRRVRLGVVPTKDMARAYMVILRWADAIFIEGGEVNIVEAKLRPVPGAVGQLEHYKMLFQHTPEFANYKTWPINLILLTTYVDLEMVELCSRKSIQYEHYIPDGYKAPY